jgi:hypothetical protein
MGEGRNEFPPNVMNSRLWGKPREVLGTSSPVHGLRKSHREPPSQSSDRTNPDLGKGTSSWSIEMSVANLQSSDRLSGEHLESAMRFPALPLTFTGLAREP